MRLHSGSLVHVAPIVTDCNLPKQIVTCVAALVLDSLLSYAGAASPVWGLNEVYSNADRTIQFVVHSTEESGQQYLGGLSLTVEGEGTKTFTFPGDLPGDSALRSFLIATQGFADLNVLKPDYVVPNGFFPVSGGVICVAGHCYQYPAIPTDGTRAFWEIYGLSGPAVAVNFAGGQYSGFPASPPPYPPPPPPPSPPEPGPPLPRAPTVPVIEYYYAAFDHYFLTADADEIGKLDNGASGWVRTGWHFNAYADSKSAITSPVCRFFSEAFAPKSSHFYSAFSFECVTVQTYPEWLLENTAAFSMALPAADGSCFTGLAPVYRLYNNGQGGAPNHRYTTDLGVRAQMLARGWVREGFGPGVAMCSPPSSQ
jgi:hypothetical protein